VTVQVNGVSDTEAGVVLNDPVDPLVNNSDGNDIVIRRPQSVVIEDLVIGWVCPVKVQGRRVQSPMEVSCCIDGKVDFGLGCGGTHGQLKVWDKIGGIFIPAAIVKVANSGGWISSAGAVIANNTQDVVCLLIVGACRLPNSTKPVITFGLVGSNNDVVALTNANEKLYDVRKDIIPSSG
jgi:hypothetical protein